MVYKKRYRGKEPWGQGSFSFRLLRMRSPVIAVAGLVLLLSACSEPPKPSPLAEVAHPVARHLVASRPPKPARVPRPRPPRPPRPHTLAAGRCKASWYASPYGASSTAATYLVRGTRLAVTYGHRTILVTVRDAGPCNHWDYSGSRPTCTRPLKGRCLDLDRRAFARLADPGAGVIDVTYRIISR